MWTRDNVKSFDENKEGNMRWKRATTYFLEQCFLEWFQYIDIMRIICCWSLLEGYFILYNCSVIYLHYGLVTTNSTFIGYYCICRSNYWLWLSQIGEILSLIVVWLMYKIFYKRSIVYRWKLIVIYWGVVVTLIEQLEWDAT